MTSDDTHEKTLELLKNNHYFGMKESQVTLMKQEKVPAMTDNDANIALNPQTFEAEMKPHGHGDAHALLAGSGLTEKWLDNGFRWVIFFQDTNGLIVNGWLTVLGVSAMKGFFMNTITVPRKPGDQSGGICKLLKPNGSEITFNVEYNQLDAMLKESKFGGDVPNDKGLSHFPGNTNSLVVAFPRYHEILKESGGLVPEFINPKYKDASRTTFKSAAKLECMLQELPNFCKTFDKNDLATAATKVVGGLHPERGGFVCG
eukprot:GHVN01067714.1.p1 GENE.GHVN01067714.1~~GHVN01067714.1.p1  ORF type:complete len:259 (+),score=32.03 GHVN01067714.1:368-1144(+)